MNTNTVEAVLFVAEKKMNDLMESFDLKPPYKVYVASTQYVTFKTPTKINKKYWMHMIERSKSQDAYWVPAISHKGKLYVSPEIMEISDGNKIIFVGKAA